MKLPRFLGRAWHRIGATLFDIPRFRLDDPRAVDMLFDGQQSPAGITVTRQTALTCSPWYRGIRLFSDLIAKLPIGVYDMLPGSGKRLNPSHQWTPALTRKASAWATPFTFKQFMVASSLVEGNGYAFIDHAAMRFRPLNPRVVTPVIEGHPDTGEEQLWYVVGLGTAKPEKYASDLILHFRGLSLDCLSGISVIDVAKESLGLSVAAKRYQSIALKNSSRPGIVLTVPTKMQPDDKKAMLAGWERMNSGVNVNRTAILDMGLKAEALGFTAEEVQLIETQKFSISDIANFIGLPAHKLGDSSRSGYAGLEQENLSMLGDSIDPVLVAHEQEFADKLLTEAEKEAGNVEIMYDRKKLTATDTTAKTNYFRTALGGHPWKTLAEVRQEDDCNHIDGTDYIPEPVNMDKSGGGDDAEEAVVPVPPKPPVAPPVVPAKGVIESATSAILAQSLARVAKRLAMKAARSGNLVVDMDALADELNDIESLVGAVRGVPFSGLARTIRDFARDEFTDSADLAAACSRFESRVIALGVQSA